MRTAITIRSELSRKSGYLSGDSLENNDSGSTVHENAMLGIRPPQENISKGLYSGRLVRS